MRQTEEELELLSLFERQFPESNHLGKVRYLFFMTHRIRDDHPKALAAAEAVLERDKTREDVLFYVAQYLLRHETRAGEGTTCTRASHSTSSIRKKSLKKSRKPTGRARKR